MAAQLFGVATVRVGQLVRLRNQWGDAGALVANVVREHRWTVRRDGQLVLTRTTVDLQTALFVGGRYQVTYTFKDMLDRSYSNTFDLRVLSSSDFDEVVLGAAVSATTGL